MCPDFASHSPATAQPLAAGAMAEECSSLCTPKRRILHSNSNHADSHGRLFKHLGSSSLLRTIAGPRAPVCLQEGCKERALQANRGCCTSGHQVPGARQAARLFHSRLHQGTRLRPCHCVPSPSSTCQLSASPQVHRALARRCHTVSQLCQACMHACSLWPILSCAPNLLLLFLDSCHIVRSS